MIAELQVLHFKCIFCFVEAGIFAAIERCQRVKAGDTLRDITDGIVYQELVDSGFLLNPSNISFQFNTDGVPVFKSSSFSFWPLHLMINELPLKKRYVKLYSTCNKLCMHMYTCKCYY